MPNEAVSPDPDIERAFEWLLGFMVPGEWERRREGIEQHLEGVMAPQDHSSGDASFRRITNHSDRIAWYLYLVDAFQHAPNQYESAQGARVLPIFKRLGTDLATLHRVRNLDYQVNRLLNDLKATPDSVLFELLVGLRWARDRWSEVEFIPASSTEKRPDIRAADGADEWYIETKRLSATSQYSENEREKWLSMWRHLSNWIHTNDHDGIVDITFHVELSTLPDDFLVQQLAGKLRLVTPPCHLISNECWDVHVTSVDYEQIDRHLSSYNVKHPSRQFQELVGGRWERGLGFTCVFEGQLVQTGERLGTNIFVSELSWLAGAYWKCDAERAIESKARDVRGHLADAVQQLPEGRRSAVHIGLETLDGGIVEVERYGRIVNTVGNFDARGKDLRFVFAHLFESYSPPDLGFVMDETIYSFGLGPEPIGMPLRALSVVVDDEDGGLPTAHWLRDAP